MNFTHVTAGIDDDGRRLDKIIRRYLTEESLSHLYGALRKGLIKVDGKKRTPDFHVAQGSDIAIATVLLNSTQMSATRRQNADVVAGNATDREPAERSRIQTISDDWILFRNEHLLILNKPYDIPVQKSHADTVSLADMVAADYARRQGKNESLSFRPGPLHRLDRKTTGIVVFSQSLRGAAWFSEAIQKHAIQKTYLALLQGTLAERQTWKDNIASEKPTERKNSAKNDTSADRFYRVSIASEGKEAHSVATPLAYGSYKGMPVTLTQVEIGTGRKHQIRAQAAFHGFPLLGDTAYGGTRIYEAQAFFLHAHKLVFCENSLGIPHEIVSDILTDFAKMSEKCLINFNSRL